MAGGIGLNLKRLKIAIIGGDLRQIKLINLLIEEGMEVRVFGLNGIDFKDNVLVFDTLHQALAGADMIIGPIPCSSDNTTLFSKYQDSPINLENVFKHIPKGKLFMAGMITPEIQKIARSYDFKIVDLLKREELSILNAIPTAEGAIQCAMENSEITIHGSRSLILGFGRCGKILAHILKGIGANLTVEARKAEDLAYIKSYGYQPMDLSRLEEFIGEFDFIFNTIPSKILDLEMLKKMKKDVLIIDLASKPGGVDYDGAKELGLKAILALGLPGKVAPKTAALIIRDTIFNIYSEMGVVK